MTHLYFWKAGEVIEEPHHSIAGNKKRGTLDIPCVDTHHAHSDPTMRYGRYGSRGWEPIPLEDFPKEFRVHLLLLGVS